MDFVGQGNPTSPTSPQQTPFFALIFKSVIMYHIFDIISHFRIHHKKIVKAKQNHRNPV